MSRVEGKIDKRAKTDAEAALELALYGRIRTPAEKAVRLYLFGKEACQTTLDKGADADGKESATYSAQNAASLCELFIDAVDRRDAKTLQAIARAVETFQPYPKAIDSLRAGILCLKNILDSKGQTMTVKRLAALLNRKLAGDIPKAPATQDSFSRLRRLAKNLRFPLKKDKTGRPKKGEK
jgi:hypothetical protein